MQAEGREGMISVNLLFFRSFFFVSLPADTGEQSNQQLHEEKGGIAACDRLKI